VVAVAITPAGNIKPDQFRSQSSPSPSWIAGTLLLIRLT
jgi:hypothetical protein